MIPRFILRQKIPYGHRPEKLTYVDFKKRHEEEQKAKQGFTLPIWDRRRVLPRKEEPTEICEGNLPMASYRYFIGSKFTSSGWAQCRVCGKTFTLGYAASAQEWLDCFKRHGEERDNFEDGCIHAMTQAIKLLGADQRCVVCNRKCKLEKWGIPMCVECRPKWMFDQKDNDALEAAIEQCMHRGMIVVRQVHL